MHTLKAYLVASSLGAEDRSTVAKCVFSSVSGNPRTHEGCSMALHAVMRVRHTHFIGQARAQTFTPHKQTHTNILKYACAHTHAFSDAVANILLKHLFDTDRQTLT